MIRFRARERLQVILRSAGRFPERYVFGATAIVGTLIATVAVLVAICAPLWTDPDVVLLYYRSTNAEAVADAMLKARLDARTLILSAAGAFVAFLSWLTTYYLKSREARREVERAERDSLAAITADISSSDEVRRVAGVVILRNMCEQPIARLDETWRAQVRAFVAAFIQKESQTSYVAPPFKFVWGDIPLMSASLTYAFHCAWLLYSIDGRVTDILRCRIGQLQASRLDGCRLIEPEIRNAWIHSIRNSEITRGQLDDVIYGEIADTRFWGVTIRRGDWRQARLTNVRFESCDFEVVRDGTEVEPGLRLSGTTWLQLREFGRVSLKNCRFNGRLVPDGQLEIEAEDVRVRRRDGSAADLSPFFKPVPPKVTFQNEIGAEDL